MRKPKPNSSSSSSSSSASGAGAGSSSSSSSERNETPEEKETRKCLDFLKDLGIKENKNFKEWALQGHPNKGGDTTLFQKVNDCMDKTFRKNKKSHEGGTRKSKRNYRKKKANSGKSRKH